jgi:molybdate/tungstate transport system substrate-binding protein
VLAFSILLLASCDKPRAATRRPSITVFAAASLARPMATVADSFRARAAVTMNTELGGSLDQARKITELGRTPDVLLLVDDEVMASLMPTHLDWYVRFATNRLAIVYAPKSRHADSISADNWWQMLTRRDVTIGRADPTVAPVGRYALATLRRAGSYYAKAGLSDRLLEHAALRYVRPNAAELATLLETGEVDYIVDYESVARQFGFSFVSLPEDLAPAVLYSVSVPRAAEHFSEGTELVSYLLSEDGKRLLRAANVDVLATPVAVGSALPPEISGIVRTASAASLAR